MFIVVLSVVTLVPFKFQWYVIIIAHCKSLCTGKRYRNNIALYMLNFVDLVNARYVWFRILTYMFAIYTIEPPTSTGCHSSMLG